MAAAPPAPSAAAETEPGEAKGGGRKKLIILLAVPLLLGGIGAGLWFGGILPKLLGMHGEAPAAAAGAGEQTADRNEPPPVFMELPEIIANLNTGPRRVGFIKLKARLELARPDDVAKIQAVLPRIQDMFQTYLRETRPEELRSSMGTYRLREELIARAEIAAGPGKVRDILFVELLVQ
jgi:flagellar FliL protein